MKLTSAKKKSIPVTLHVSAWLILVFLPQIIINKYWGNNNFVAWGFYISAVIYGMVFYLNYLWLVPRFYFKENKLWFFVSATITIVAFYFLLVYANKTMHDPERDKQIAEAFKKLADKNIIPRPPVRQLQTYYYALLSVVVTGFSVGLRVIEQHAASEKKQKELEKEKLNSELAFLKNQISPHFFFNTLNNIYSLIEVSSADAQEAVMKLSRMMRYLLYESESGQTPLHNEINFMNHYIDLMRLRLSKKVDLKVELPSGKNNMQIPPLLFISFVENAFKHGVSYREKSFIHISMKLEGEKILFTCKNSIGRAADREIDKNHSGIGLENVQKRLKLLFPERHKLNIEKKDGHFNVFLEINLTGK